MKVLSRLLTALNFDPSIATLAFATRPIRRHSSTNRAHTFLIAAPLSLRKSAIVLWPCNKRCEPAAWPNEPVLQVSSASRELEHASYDATRGFFQTFANAFVKWIDTQLAKEETKAAA